MRPLPLALAFAVALVTACSSQPPKACRVGADCASGVCGSDGECLSIDEDTDGGGADAGGTDASEASDGGVDGGTDGGVNGEADGGPDGGLPLTCVPNHDGVITAEELPLRAGLKATYRAAQDVMVDTAGTQDGDGGRVWSFEGAQPGDSSVLWETHSTAGAWYAGDFPSATYAARLSSSSDLRGVFEVRADGVYLLGVVSPSGDYPSTNLSYSPVVKVLALPLSEGSSWQTSTTVSGTYLGALAYYTESYTSLVDGRGVARTPFADFPVLRVRTVVVKGGNPFTTTRTFAFTAECFSAVAQVVSAAGETSVEFTAAAELRRLSP